MEFLIFYKIDGSESLNKKVVTANELTRLIDESDFNPVDVVKILVIDDPENIFEVRYAGWQPGCVIDFVDDNGDVVYRGYGTDH